MFNLRKKIVENRWLVTFLIILIFISALLYNNKNLLYSWADDFKLIPRKETFTELYFNDYSRLPQQFEQGKTVSFSFVVRNLEGKDMPYPYLVFLESNNGLTILGDGIIQVNDNETKIISVSYNPVVPISDGIVTVSLTQLNQNIHFIIRK